MLHTYNPIINYQTAISTLQKNSVTYQKLQGGGHIKRNLRTYPGS
ncbi:hypothetical protein VCHA38O209_80153 [Vibrio chagasii]|nr:hypothetical protein VCHA38O209_80153 [Vibrio chagasii]